MLDPLHQFAVSPILNINVGGFDLSFTNSSLAVMVAFLMIATIFALGVRSRRLIPDRMQASVEVVYFVIADLIDSNVGRAGRKYFPLVFSVFLFVLFGNIVGLIPHMFTFTSHIVVTFSLALIVFIFVTVLGFVLHGIKFLKLFAPDGVPKFIMPLLIFVELVSYLIRPISLAIRLFANMMAGHTMIKVFAGLLGLFGSWLVPVIVPVNMLMTGLELFVATLQAYIFAVLTCVYLNDAVHLH
ncbi:MAG: F0F1 ATP synthase subunit A [Holosporaceae bacterium]|jgi:F-type H+-transporting ATPase subunit a|nr:F0F1 ATP synthase subunit A [Holosporaceae bacterium]